MLELLKNGPMSAGELAAHFNQSASTMSGHFAVLKEADLIQPTRNGTSIVYRLNMTVLEDAVLQLMSAFGMKGGES